jgi:hypothetical protein
MIDAQTASISKFQNAPEEFLKSLEEWCVAFNEFAVVFFWYMKYILAFILIAIGLMTILRLRGIYLQPRMRNIDKKVVEHDQLDNPRLILAAAYIIIGSGILLNWFTRFLIWALDPLPDRVIFKLINFQGQLDPYDLNRIRTNRKKSLIYYRETYYLCTTQKY